MNIQIDINGTNFATASNVYDIYQQRGDKNVFELVLDGLILERYSDNDEVKAYIKSLPNANKRLATLSLLSNDNVLWRQINDLVKKEQSSYERLKGIYNLIKDYVRIADVDRKGKGEIHTPFKELAEPMVKLVEKYDKDFWKNKDHKVLDSSAGYGTFLILAAYKFMVGLKDVIEDEEERFKWIVENCLYYGELQARSAFSWLVSIDPFDKYKVNIFWGSFLDGTSLSKDFEEHMKNVWKVDKFDLIIQNPPYQIQKDTDKNKNSKNPKTKPIWHLFVNNSISLLKENKYMVMVHPGGWRNLDGIFKETQNLLKEKQMLYLNINTFKDGLNLFGAKTNFDYYILKNSDNKNTLTKIICEDNSEENINIKNIEFIPGENITYIYDLIAKDDEDRVNILHSYSAYEPRKNFISKDKNDINIYPCVYMVSYIDKPTFLYSSRKDRGHFGVKKVIFASGSSGIILDKNGNYGLTPFSYGIVDDVENFENIQKALKNKDFIEKVMLYKHGLGHKYDSKILSLLRKDFWKKFV